MKCQKNLEKRFKNVGRFDENLLLFEFIQFSRILENFKKLLENLITSYASACFNCRRIPCIVAFGRLEERAPFKHLENSIGKEKLKIVTILMVSMVVPPILKVRPSL